MPELAFSLFIIFIIYKIISTSNAVNSALFLILLAITLSMFLFYLGVNFLAILYLAVYIGAVAVFFLFVVMMTDLNNSESNNKSADIFLFFCLIASIVGVHLLDLFSYLNPKIFSLIPSNLNIDSFNSNIETVGLSMFTEHSGPFVLISIIILVALIGSIFITFKSEPELSVFSTNENRTQDMEMQLSRTVLSSVNLQLNSKL